MVGSRRLSAIDTVSSQRFKEKPSLNSVPAHSTHYGLNRRKHQMYYFFWLTVLPQLVVLLRYLEPFALADIFQKEMSRSIVMIFTCIRSPHEYSFRRFYVSELTYYLAYNSYCNLPLNFMSSGSPGISNWKMNKLLLLFFFIKAWNEHGKTILFQLDNLTALVWKEQQILSCVVLSYLITFLLSTVCFLFSYSFIKTFMHSLYFCL